MRPGSVAVLSRHNLTGARLDVGEGVLRTLGKTCSMTFPSWNVLVMELAYLS